ncbi:MULTISPECIES: RDD family protein [unclassified Campylobacter]|uniref:RDD family protein n=1 Tax=unclassified Campylobacter TaxID=2593542 RepID=UPI0022E9A2E8|nr:MULTISPECIES: RDD family protein [unclassified Campylobacter]MDA3080049.1 RDD family protein [Campylobacter sp. CS_NA2]MDA3081733.1 RDD family protein [Campylobacter sp. CS_NA1]MDA3086106.1 RDD family protein [Campylobacter sp. CS_ED1]MDA3090945.1 RDD family protein [Campylobacter sp. CS_ED2]WBR51213.1 RDD family protein [Campylobacter sp. CS_NA3]
MAKTKAGIAPIFLRIKAFIVDMFFIAMPLLYITTYLVLGSKEAFQENQFAIAIVWAIYGLITSIFIAKSAQTPGYKFSQIYLIDLKTGRKISFFKAFLRFVCFILAGFSIMGLFLCFFRKDKLNLHDLLTQTAPVIKKS